MTHEGLTSTLAQKINIGMQIQVEPWELVAGSWVIQEI